MGLMSWLFGGKDSKEAEKSRTVADAPVDDDLQQAIEAEEARRAFDEQQAQRLVREHEQGMYQSWEDVKRKNPDIPDQALEEAANLHWQHPREKDRFDESMNRRL